MSKKLSMAIVIALALCATGCANVRSGMHNAVSDAMDIVRVDVSGSFGTDMGAHVMATKFVQLKSYSYEDLYRVGFGTRHIGVWKEDREDWWIGPIHARNMNINRKSVAEIIAPSSGFKMLSRRNAAFHYIMESPDEVGLGAHFLVVGARAGVRPWEFVDFLANFVGLDPCNDNAKWYEMKRLRSKLKAAKAAAKAKNTVPAPTDNSDKEASNKNADNQP